MARVLVTDGEQRAALAVARSLGRAGHEVFVTSTRGRSLAGASRYARQELATPDPLRAAGAFAESARGIVERLGIEVLIPISEASLLAILPERDRFAGVTIPFPGAATFDRICDKAAVLEAARAHGIQAPRQWRLESPADRERLPSEALRYPLVLKPARSVVGMGDGRAKTGVVHVADEAAALTALGALPEAAFPVLVQERIVGPGVGIFALLWGGELVAAFSHRRIREKPPSGGVSVHRESIAADPALLSSSVALLRAFDWEGVAMVEYKLDERSGTPYLMEINGRFWGSLQLAVDAGVDFPALLVEAAAGRRPQPVLTYRSGVRSRWWWGDVDHLIARLRRTREELSLPPDAPGRVRAVIDFLGAFGPSSRNEVLRLGDPFPAVRETLDWIRGR